MEINPLHCPLRTGKFNSYRTGDFCLDTNGCCDEKKSQHGSWFAWNGRHILTKNVSFCLNGNIQSPKLSLKYTTLSAIKIIFSVKPFYWKWWTHTPTRVCTHTCLSCRGRDSGPRQWAVNVCAIVSRSSTGRNFLNLLYSPKHRMLLQTFHKTSSRTVDSAFWENRVHDLGACRLSS